MPYNLRMPYKGVGIYAADVLAYSPDEIRPEVITFDTDISTTSSPIQSRQRIHPEYDLAIEQILGILQTSNGLEQISLPFLLQVQLRDLSQNYDVFRNDVTMAYFMANGIRSDGLEFKVPHLARAGSDMRTTFTTLTGFGSSDKAASLMIKGTYVRRDIQICVPQIQSTELLRDRLNSRQR